MVIINKRTFTLRSPIISKKAFHVADVENSKTEGGPGLKDLSRNLLTQMHLIVVTLDNSIAIRTWIAVIALARIQREYPAKMCGIGGSAERRPRRSPESDPHASARSITRGVHHHGVPPSSL